MIRLSRRRPSRKSNPRWQDAPHMPLLCGVHIDLSIGRWDISFSNTSRRKRSEGFLRLHTTDERHYIWGNWSLYIEDATVENIIVCGECDSEGDDGMTSGSMGDESFSWCESCGTVEGSTYYVSKRNCRA